LDLGGGVRGTVYSIIEENHSKILKLWKERFFLDIFGEDVKSYFLKEVDPFQNPLASRVDEIFSSILKEIKSEFSLDALLPYLERLAQVLAIYVPSAKKAMGTFLKLKGIIRENFGDEILERFGVKGLLQMEDLINSLMVLTFDFYMKYRERLFEIRYEEWKRNHYLLLKRAGLVYDPMEGTPLVKKFDPEKH
jgi:hypothetical protein